MSMRDDVTRAGDEARSQVQAARDALAASRTARGGGPAKNAREAERQLAALRGAVADDVRALRDRVGGLDPAARRGAATVAGASAAAVATLVGSGLALRGSLRRASQQRGLRHQATALALELARQAAGPQDGAGSGARRGRRTGRRLVGALVVVGAVAGAAVVAQRRNAPIDDADLWLPEQDLGPA
jgi:hypothetical protein